MVILLTVMRNWKSTYGPFMPICIRNRETDRNFNENCIHEFLGEDIVNLRLVQDSIIPPELRQELESPITVEELDLSVAQGNKSASGMDGLSNCFIKKYWEFYVPRCIGTPSFVTRTAGLHIISVRLRSNLSPKKATQVNSKTCGQ